MSKENILLLLDTARKNIFSSQVKIEQLEKQNAMMREALEFYADKENWQERYDDESRFSHPRDIGDGGKRAREVLEKLTRGE